MSSNEAVVAVGSPAPDFSLESSDGKQFRLADYKGTKNVVLYFMREFVCLQCQRHAMNIGRMNEQLQALDTQVLIIGGGSLADAVRLSKAYKFPFPVLYDRDRSSYRRYGLEKVMFAIQRSGSFLIDKQGILRYVHQATNPGGSVDERELLQEVEKLKKA